MFVYVYICVYFPIEGGGVRGAVRSGPAEGSAVILCIYI